AGEALRLTGFEGPEYVAEQVVVSREDVLDETVLPQNRQERGEELLRLLGVDDITIRLNAARLIRRLGTESGVQVRDLYGYLSEEFVFCDVVIDIVAQRGEQDSSDKLRDFANYTFD